MIGLRLSNLGFSYGDRILLHNANLSLTSLGITCITGCNGSDKSTFLRLLHGLINPNSGSVQWIGLTAPSKITMVFQKPLMLRRSVLANIEFAVRLAKSNTNPLTYLQQVNLEHLAKTSARTLSGGEQQKLALARAFALQPEVILLDEPTAHLDTSTSLKIEQLLIDLSVAGKKILLVSHDMNQVERLAEDRLHLQEGKLLYNSEEI